MSLNSELMAVQSNNSLTVAQKMQQIAQIQNRYASGNVSSSGVTGGLTGASIALGGSQVKVDTPYTGKTLTLMKSRSEPTPVVNISSNISPSDKLAILAGNFPNQPEITRATMNLKQVSEPTPVSMVTGSPVAMPMGQAVENVSLKPSPSSKLAVLADNFQNLKLNRMLGRSNVESKIVSIENFRRNYPDVEIPKSNYGDFDRVEIVTKQAYIDPNEPFKETTNLRFFYSNKAKHKIEIAGSVENYKKYWDILKAHPEIAGLHAVVGPLNLDLAFASNVRPYGLASEREEILIKQLHDFKGSPEGGPSLERGIPAVLSSPFVQIALAEAGGFAIGKVTGSASGALAARYGPKAVQAFNLAEAAVGGAIAAPEVYEIGKTAYEGKTGEAVTRATMFGLTFGAGLSGYKSGRAATIARGKFKGLTSYEKGILKNVDKSKWLSTEQKNIIKSFYPIEQELMTLTPKQRILVNRPTTEPSFTNVRSLQKGGFNVYKKGYVQGVKNIVRSTKSEIYGGAAIEKPSTGDIDLAFRSARNAVELDFIARRLGVEPSDIHQLLRVGQQTEFLGARKMPSIKTPSGLKRIDMIDQVLRIGQGSALIEHKGRLKDLPETIRELKIIFKRAYPKGIPKDIQMKISKLETAYSAALKNPEAIMIKTPQSIYGDSKFWELQRKFYQKVTPEKTLQRKASKYTEMPIEYFRGRMGGPAAKTSIKSSLRSPSVNPSTMFSSWSSVADDIEIFSSSFRSPSISPSISMRSASPSSRASRSSKPSGSRRSKSPSMPSSLFPIFSSDFSKSSKSSSSRSSSVRSSSSRSSSSRSSTSSSVAPPPPSWFWFPGMGGKVASRGKIEPYGVKYIDEYALMQKMLKDVIF